MAIAYILLRTSPFFPPENEKIRKQKKMKPKMKSIQGQLFYFFCLGD